MEVKGSCKIVEGIFMVEICKVKIKSIFKIKERTVIKLQYFKVIFFSILLHYSITVHCKIAVIIFIYKYAISIFF